jgi:hypothetical protein
VVVLVDVTVVDTFEVGVDRHEYAVEIWALAKMCSGAEMASLGGTARSSRLTSRLAGGGPTVTVVETTQRWTRIRTNRNATREIEPRILNKKGRIADRA